MDAKVWQNLPHDLLDRALAWLPIYALFRLRCVCKHWKNLVMSPEFINLWVSIPRQKQPWLAFSTSSGFLLCFDFSSGHWLHLSLRFLPPGFPQCLSSASSGLFLIESPKGSPRNRFHVCNPLTQTLFELPPSFTFESGFAWTGFAADLDGKNFRVLAVGWGESGLVIELYMSLVNDWHILDAYPFATASPITHCDGVFYWFMARSQETAMVEFDVNGPACRLLSLPSGELGFQARLLDCEGCLVMVGGSFRDGSYEYIGIWRLKKATRDWELVEKMSWEVVAYRNGLGQQERLFCIECVGVANWVCIRANGGWEEVFAYNLNDNSWKWLPSAAGFGCILMAGFAYHPNLASP